MQNPKVLVIFGNIPLYGQERSNIEVFYQLKKHGIEALFVTHKQYGHLHVQPFLSKLGLDWTEATFAGKLDKKSSFIKVVSHVFDCIIGSWELLVIAFKFKPNYIHIFNSTFFTNLYPALLFLQRPIIFLAGDEPPTHHWAHRFIWKKLLVPLTTRFVCISKFIKDSLIRSGVPGQKIADVILNFPPTFIADVLDERLIDSLCKNDNTRICYMGQISEQKGVDILVKSAFQICQQRTNVQFLIAGDHTYNNPFAKALIREVNRLGLKEKIVFLGFVHSIPQLLSVSNLHVCPSVWDEPLSNVVGEAKRASIPSVIFPSGGLPELIQHKIDGFICREKSVQGLLEGLNYYLDHLELLKRDGNNALKSLNRMGMNQFHEKWKKIYEGDL